MIVESLTNEIKSKVISELEFNVPFQHKHGYIRDESKVIIKAL